MSIRQLYVGQLEAVMRGKGGRVARRLTARSRYPYYEILRLQYLINRYLNCSLNTCTLLLG